MQLSSNKKSRKKFNNKPGKKPLIPRSKEFTKPSLLATTSMLLASAISSPTNADEVAVQYLLYDENDDRVSVNAVSVDYIKDIGTDDNIKLSYTYDSVSGGTPTWVDAISGGSQRSTGVVKEAGQLIKIDDQYKAIPFDDTRNAADLLWIHRFADRDEVEVGVNFSNETDFLSYGSSAEYRLNLNNANTTVSFGGSYLKNEVTPNSLPSTVDNFPSEPNLFIDKPTTSFETFDFINLQTGITQVLTTTSLVSASLFTVIENGYLNNPYLRVIREYTVRTGSKDKYIFEDSRPDSRVAYGISLKHVKEYLEKYTLHSGYRFYHDDWDIYSHTVDFKLYTKINEKITLMPGIRYYYQTKAYFYGDIFPEKFATKFSVNAAQKYASSDFRLGNYHAIIVNMGFNYKLNEKYSYNILGGILDQSTGLTSFILTGGIKYIF